MKRFSFLIVSLVMVLISTSHVYSQYEAAYDPKRDPKTPFRYVIVSGVSEIERFVNDNTELKTMIVLMDDKSFGKRNLLKLFKLLRARFPNTGLSVSVYTSLRSVLTPEEMDHVELYGPVNDYHKFKYALYNLNLNGEYFYYGIPGKKRQAVTIQTADEIKASKIFDK